MWLFVLHCQDYLLTRDVLNSVDGDSHLLATRLHKKSLEIEPRQLPPLRAVCPVSLQFVCEHKTLRAMLLLLTLGITFLPSELF